MQTQVSASQAFRYIIQTLKPFKLSLAVMIMVTLYNGLILSLGPFILKKIINIVANSTTSDLWPLLLSPVLIYLCLQFFIAVSYRLHEYFINIRMIPLLRTNIVQQSTDSLLAQSHSYFQNTLAGSLTNKVNDISNNIPELLQLLIDKLLYLGLLVLFAIMVLASVNYKFALLMFSWVALFSICVVMASNKIGNLAQTWSESLSMITGKLVDIFANILSVRLFSTKKQEANALATTLAASVIAERKFYWAYFWVFVWYSVLTVSLTALSMYFLITGREQGYITIGDFALVFLINFGVINELWMFAKDFANLSKLLGRITQALNSILLPPEIVDNPGAKKLIVKSGQIEFNNVHFNYKGHDAVFENKSVLIPAGQKVGLVGFSGGGKTTFVNLILRMYDISAGKILIDDQDIRDVTQDSLHDAISMIPQDPSLFHRSLMDNIRYAKINASDDEVYNAARAAHANEFIAKLPLGYSSLVGERGVKLSGGQRQRIAIARAILKDAPILILDEATSQLDSVTESVIQNSLWDLMQAKTTIVIAHRLSTLLRMDRILVFDQGKIVEDGTHTELLAQNKLYKLLWEAQVGGFLPP